MAVLLCAPQYVQDCLTTPSPTLPSGTGREGGKVLAEPQTTLHPIFCPLVSHTTPINLSNETWHSTQQLGVY